MRMDDPFELASQTVASFKRKKQFFTTAESCTGGLIAALTTEIPGASNVFDRGFVTYSNESKIDLLGVLPDLLTEYGAVSAEVAEAMAEGALAYSKANVAVSVTGIAGPDGGTPLKPVGLVYLGLATRNGPPLHYKCNFTGDRRQIRLAAATEAFKLLLSTLEEID